MRAGILHSARRPALDDMQFRSKTINVALATAARTASRFHLAGTAGDPGSCAYFDCYGGPSAQILHEGLPASQCSLFSDRGDPGGTLPRPSRWLSFSAGIK